MNSFRFLATCALAASCPAQVDHFDTLRDRARDLATRPHLAAPTDDLPAWLARLDYDDYRKLRFREDTALWSAESLPFRLTFSHRGYLFPRRVPIHVLDGDTAAELMFSPNQFQYGLPAQGELPSTLGYAGVTVLTRNQERWTEVASFRGASFFRLVGINQNYGASARGLAVDTAEPSGEEHPAFVEIWIERPLPGAERLTLYALLDSPSVTGAYRIVLRPGEATAADIDLHLYFRRKVRKLGVAPLSSMFLHGELRLRHVEDYRPERHDSDGLLSADGKDTWTWRPLLNPDGMHVVTAQRLDDPVGFGLLQRDRAHTAYLDLEDRYELRPSMWIEARGKWGPGRLELLEIPSAVAHNDNIACYWVPDRTFDAGATLAISYTLSAFADDPNRPPLARAHNTLHERVGDVDRFLIDFVGPQLGDDAANLRADVQSSKDEVRNIVVQPNPANGGVRVSFEVDASTDDAELRASLWRDRRQVSETWVLPWRRQR